MTPEDFWSKVKKGSPDECWPFGNAKTYGQTKSKVMGERTASRIAYALTNGAIPPRLLVCHKCDNPPCCNPAHLFVGTHKDNSMDYVRKGRRSNIETGRGFEPTTIHIPGTLRRGGNKLAAFEGRSFSSFMVQLLRREIARAGLPLEPIPASRVLDGRTKRK